MSRAEAADDLVADQEGWWVVVGGERVECEPGRPLSAPVESAADDRGDGGSTRSRVSLRVTRRPTAAAMAASPPRAPVSMPAADTAEGVHVAGGAAEQGGVRGPKRRVTLSPWYAVSSSPLL
ncbi:hypothetical protein [Streptomyces sp. NPDC050121]|uniref:hypothetical protein n=1 Tax=Streptomyces sp. NPDC050121 TaxID=3365601 RepID=UPI0037928ECC